MNTKLTLTIEQSTIEKAKRFAKETGRSLSDIIEKYLEKITATETQITSSSKISRLKGSVKLPEDFNEDVELRAYYENKHL
jgi:hypothetical protein